MFLITMGESNGFAFQVKEELQVRESLHIKDLAGGHRHTALLINSGFSTNTQRITPLVSGLMRAGFPHVILYQGP